MSTRIQLDIIRSDAKLLLRVLENWVANGDDEPRYFIDVEAMVELDRNIKKLLRGEMKNGDS